MKMKNMTIKIVLDDEKDFNSLISLIAGLKEEVPFIFEVIEEIEKK
jgi:hypothetical protein